MFKFSLCLFFFSAAVLGNKGIIPYKFHIEKPLGKRAFTHRVGKEYLHSNTELISYIRLFAMYSCLSFDEIAKVIKWSEEPDQFNQEYKNGATDEGIFFDAYIQTSKQGLAVAITLINRESEEVEDISGKSLKNFMSSFNDFVCWQMRNQDGSFLARRLNESHYQSEVLSCHSMDCKVLGYIDLSGECKFCSESEQMKKNNYIDKADRVLISKNITYNFD